jgi:hypothetical protein
MKAFHTGTLQTLNIFAIPKNERKVKIKKIVLPITFNFAAKMNKNSYLFCFLFI